MVSRPVTDEALIRRMMPQFNADRQDRARAWAEWQDSVGEQVLLRFIRAHNSTTETDDDIVQEALLTAYIGVEGGRYQPHEGIPFIAYVVGIARNKIREARRRERRHTGLDEDSEEFGPRLMGAPHRQPEQDLERSEQRQLLRDGLARLPVARRKVLEHYLSGARTEEIAASLAMSEALVRQHKCRGLRALRSDPLITGLTAGSRMSG